MGGPERRGRTTDTSGPYERRVEIRSPPNQARQQPQPQQPQQLPPELMGDGSFIKVSTSSNIKAVAGKLAHSSRNGDPPAILTIGPSCVNQAVKSIAVARSYLASDNIDISFQPAFRDTDRNKASLALFLAKQRSVLVPPRVEFDDELSVSAKSVPASVAGAIAVRVRGRKPVSVTAIGVEAVAKATLAIGSARLYLEADRLDIRALPEFITVRKNDMDLNAVRFHITFESI